MTYKDILVEKETVLADFHSKGLELLTTDADVTKEIEDYKGRLREIRKLSILIDKWMTRTMFVKRSSMRLPKLELPNLMETPLSFQSFWGHL